MTFKEFVVSLFKDERGAISVKPVIGMIGALTLCIFLVLTSYIKVDTKLLDNIINAVMLITIVGMGGDTIDKFSYRKNQLGIKDDTNTEEEKPEEK